MDMFIDRQILGILECISQSENTTPDSLLNRLILQANDEPPPLQAIQSSAPVNDENEQQ